MYDQSGDDGKAKWTVAQIPAGFGVTRSTIYRYLELDAVNEQVPPVKPR